MDKLGRKFIDIERDKGRDSPEMSKLTAKAITLYQTINRNLFSLIKGNNNPFGENLFLLFSGLLHESQLEEIIPNLSKRTLQKYQNLKEITEPRKELVGQQYFPFTAKIIDDENLLLSNVVASNKVVLLDFWASWCMPCLKEMPTLIQLYEKYKDKGLEIVGISIDENELSWRKAVKKHKMPWVQTIDNKEESFKVAKLYNIFAIPHVVLIDSNGTIVGEGSLEDDLIVRIKNLLQ